MARRKKIHYWETTTGKTQESEAIAWLIVKRRKRRKRAFGKAPD